MIRAFASRDCPCCHCLLLWFLLGPVLIGTTTAAGTKLAALPEGNAGIAARYPQDKDIATDPSVIFHDDFENGDLRARWDAVMHAANVRIAQEPANVNSGKSALEFTVPRQEHEVSNTVRKELGQGHDTVYLRYYSKFDPGFDQVGSSHNGGYLGAHAPGLPYATPGVRADGKLKFIATFENWRDDTATPSPGGLNIYCYHPEQRSDYGDHFFPSGTVLPLSYQRGNFGPAFVRRADITPALGRWYCYEFMLQANRPGRRDGRIACWLDGKLIADFPNLRLRDVDSLKINYASLDLHIRSNGTRANRKWYDDVVIASSYIGPMTDDAISVNR